MVALLSIPLQLEKEGPDAFPFWIRPISVFILIRIEHVYQQFRSVNHIARHCVLYKLTLTDMLSPSEFHSFTEPSYVHLEA